jgi:hypothetical protein
LGQWSQFQFVEAAAGEPLIPVVIALMNRRRFTRTDRNGRGYSDVNVHSLVRTGTKAEAERVGKYMIRPVVSGHFLQKTGPS